MRFIKDPNIVQIVVEKSRWKIWTLLRDKGDLTAEEISKIIDKNVSTVYRHLKKLIKAGFVNERETYKKGDQKYTCKIYSAEMTESFFILSEEVEYKIEVERETSILADTVQEVIKNLIAMGVGPNADNESETRKLLRKILLKQSKFVGSLKEINGMYDHHFEVTRRILTLLLLEEDDEYKQDILHLKKLLS